MPHIPRDHFSEFIRQPGGASQAQPQRPTQTQADTPEQRQRFGIDRISMKKWQYSPDYVQQQLFGKEPERHGST